jgi:hypothetical protein
LYSPKSPPFSVRSPVVSEIFTCSVSGANR